MFYLGATVIVHALHAQGGLKIDTDLLLYHHPVEKGIFS
jgi:hypothetical protein